MVFSLNVAGSFADDITPVVSRVRYHLHGYLLANAVLEVIRCCTGNAKPLTLFWCERHDL